MGETTAVLKVSRACNKWMHRQISEGRPDHLPQPNRYKTNTLEVTSIDIISSISGLEIKFQDTMHSTLETYYFVFTFK